MIYRSTGYGGTWLPAFHPVCRTREAGWNCWCPPVLGYRTSSCLTLFPLRPCAFATLRSLLLSCLPLYPSTLCVLAPLRPCVPFFSSALNTRTKRGDSPRVFSVRNRRIRTRSFLPGSWTWRTLRLCGEFGTLIDCPI
jgi:hypothetical protein